MESFPTACWRTDMLQVWGNCENFISEMKFLPTGISFQNSLRFNHGVLWGLLWPPPFPNQTVISLGFGHDLLAQVDGLLSAQHTHTIPTSARRELHPSQATERFYPSEGHLGGAGAAGCWLSSQPLCSWWENLMLFKILNILICFLFSKRQSPVS